MAANRMTRMGETPSNQMASAQTMGIQHVLHVILALLAKLNVGTAIRATTAGRMPRKMLATTGLS